MAVKEELVEHAARAAWYARCKQIRAYEQWTSQQCWDEASGIEKSRTTEQARAALAAALPTPEEHARGIEAAAAAISEIPMMRSRDQAGAGIAAYFSAVGLAP